MKAENFGGASKKLSIYLRAEVEKVVFPQYLPKL